MRRLEEAIAQYKTAVHLKPDYADAHNNLGAALASLGRTQEAITEFQAALRIQPDYAQARTKMDLALKQR
jgi:tetratricopeptide (TPR) repeat protein